MIALGFGEEQAPAPECWELHAIQETGRRRGYRFELRRGNVSHLLKGWADQILMIEDPDTALSVVRLGSREIEDHRQHQSARAYALGGN